MIDHDADVKAPLLKIVGKPDPSEGLTRQWLLLQRLDLADALTICESPIEVMLGTALLCAADGEGAFLRLCHGTGGKRRPVLAKGRAGSLSAQHGMRLEGRNVRLDFALILGDKKIAIETDGHDFHEKTKEQATDRASRDRVLSAAGWTTMHFTGSEVYRDAARCASEVLRRFGCVTRTPAHSALSDAASMPLFATTDTKPSIASTRRVPFPTMPDHALNKVSASAIIAAIVGEPVASDSEPFIPRKFIPRPRAR